MLLLVIAYFAIISILTISFRVWEAQFIILLMPILCYLGFTFHLFIKAVIGSRKLMERIEYGYFIFGLVFTLYTLYELLTPSAYEILKQTTWVGEHRVERLYTRQPMYILYVIYIATPIFWATFKLIKTIRSPTNEQKEILPLAKSILWIYISSISFALLSLSVAPILGFKQSPALGSFALMLSVIAYAWILLRNRAWRLEALTEKIILRETELRERNETIERDLDFTRVLHRKLLPSVLPRDHFLDSRIFYQSVDKVGGDFYDFVKTPNSWRIILGDVSGHGVSAGFFSAMASLILRDFWKDSKHSLIDAAQYLNAEILRYSANGIFISAVFVEIHFLTGETTIINAGHPSIFHLQKNCVNSLTVPGRLLGVVTDSVFNPKTITLEHGDTLLFYTDGLLETTNENGEEFQENKLSEVLNASLVLSLEQREERLLTELHTFRGKIPLEDDLTLLQIRYL
ncbi:MAG: hypothetical protein LDLANPLL_02709 [Turneriella sp.]|nr:hypothetical protein [Turneriella sp.]